MDNTVKQVDKKPYSPPHLIVHGTVRDLTKKVGPAHTGDGGKLPKTRTGMR